MGVIFVGEVTNPADLDESLALTGPTGKNLAQIAGLQAEDYLRLKRLNVDPTGTGTPLDHARRARMIEERAQAGDCIVMLGRKVIAAFGWPAELTWYTRVGIGRGVVAVAFPHPSPKNVYWNDPVNRQEAERHLRAIIKEFES